MTVWTDGDLAECLTRLLDIKGCGDDWIAFVTAHSEELAALERVQEKQQSEPLDPRRRPLSVQSALLHGSGAVGGLMPMKW